MSRHLCHARGCKVAVPPRMLMCIRHWRLVPKDLKAEVWRVYRPGQEITKTPTDEYLEVARAAIRAVAEKEGLATPVGQCVQEVLFDMRGSGALD